MKMMLQKEKSFRVLYIVLTASSVLGVTVGTGLAGYLLLDATAQNQTAATNQTAAPSTANTTRGDFNPVRDNINSAREALFNNDTDISYDFLSTAGNEIFDLTQITEDEVAADEPSVNQTMVEQLRVVKEKLDNAQSSLSNNDNPKALQEINSADAELLIVTRDLPP
jgi:hypothetical protein